MLEPFSTCVKSRTRTADTATGLTPRTAAAVSAKTPILASPRFEKLSALLNCVRATFKAFHYAVRKAQFTVTVWAREPFKRSTMQFEKLSALLQCTRVPFKAFYYTVRKAQYTSSYAQPFHAQPSHAQPSAVQPFPKLPPA